MLKGEFSINTARNCVCWLKKKVVCLLLKCLLLWTVLYILLMRYAWEVTRNHYWNCNYTLFFNSCIVWGEKKKKERRWCVFGTLRVGNKIVSCEPNHNTVAFDEQKQWELFPRVSEVRPRACLSASPKQNSSSGIEILIIFNVSPSLSRVWDFYVISGSCLGYSIFFLFVCFYSLCEVVKRNIG